MAYQPGMGGQMASAVPSGGAFPGSQDDPTALLGISAGESSVTVRLKRMAPSDITSPGALQMINAGRDVSGGPMSIGNALLHFWRGMDDTERSAVSAQLLHGNFYDAQFYRKRPPPIKLTDTGAAWQRAVEEAALLGVSVEEVLKNGSRLGGGGAGGAGAGGGTRAPLTVKLTNPADIQSVADHAAQTLLGRKASDAEKVAITKAYQSAERGAQTAEYNAGVGGGESVAAPDLSSFTAQQLRAQNPAEAGAHDVAGTVDAFMSLLGVKV